jgi:N-acetylmuramoyl-L-alanine amidase
VLFQRGQFSFVRGGRWPSVQAREPQWKNAVAIAKIVDRRTCTTQRRQGAVLPRPPGQPGLAPDRVATVGNHVFYR